MAFYRFLAIILLTLGGLGKPEMWTDSGTELMLRVPFSGFSSKVSNRLKPRASPRFLKVSHFSRRLAAFSLNSLTLHKNWGLLVLDKS